jgi:cobalamin biosynthesis protein CbiG
MSTDSAGPVRILAGIGCRRGATGAELVALVNACLAEAGLPASALGTLVTRSDRADHPAVRAAAQHFDVAIRAIDTDTLACQPVPNPSARIERLTGLVSVAEAAAAASGSLILQKRLSPNCTCALARDKAAGAAARAA